VAQIVLINALHIFSWRHSSRSSLSTLRWERVSCSVHCILYPVLLQASPYPLQITPRPVGRSLVSVSSLRVSCLFLVRKTYTGPSRGKNWSRVSFFAQKLFFWGVLPMSEPALCRSAKISSLSLSTLRRTRLAVCASHNSVTSSYRPSAPSLLIFGEEK
jgi:hypothetical protein